MTTWLKDKLDKAKNFIFVSYSKSHVFLFFPLLEMDFLFSDPLFAFACRLRGGVCSCTRFILSEVDMCVPSLHDLNVILCVILLCTRSVIQPANIQLPFGHMLNFNPH